MAAGKKRSPKGTGSIYQRKDGRWAFKYIGTDKKEHYFYAPTRAEALDLRSKILADNMVLRSPNKVSEYIRSWLAMKAHILKPQSFDRIESTVNIHILPAIGDMKLCDLTDHIFMKQVLDMMRSKGLSFSSIKKAYDAFNACMEYYQAKGEIKINPIAAMGAPNRAAYERFRDDDIGDIVSLDREQREAFVTACYAKYSNGTRMYKNSAAYILALNTGLREGELLALQWDMVSLNSLPPYIKIARNLVQTKDRNPKSPTYGRKILQVSGFTKTSKPRMIPLNAPALNALMELKTIAEQKGSQLVVSNLNGDLLLATAFSKSFKSICDLADIHLPSGYSIHALRHTFASSLFSNGMSVKEVSALLGHNSVQLTMDTYIDLINEKNLLTSNAIPDEL